MMMEERKGTFSTPVPKLKVNNHFCLFSKEGFVRHQRVRTLGWKYPNYTKVK